MTPHCRPLSNRVAICYWKNRTALTRYLVLSLVSVACLLLVGCGDPKPTPYPGLFTLTLTADPPEGGAVVTPEWIIPSANGGMTIFATPPAERTQLEPRRATFPAGTSVVVSTLAGPDFRFTGWSGACSGTARCVVVMNGDRSVSASFTR